MYAYVKLINSRKFTTVGTNQIKNYKPNRPSKVFEVKIKGEYHKCLIGLTNDIFSYYLKESAQFDKDKHDAQMKQFYNYVLSKITDSRAEKKRPNEKKLPKVKLVESSDTEDISDIEEDTIASNGEEDSGESTDEVSDQESDNAMIQEREEEVEKADVDHEAEPTVAIVNTIEEKSIEERKEESEPNNSSNPNNNEEKVTD